MTLMVGGTVSGGSGCNRCSGSAEVANGNGLTIGPLVTTRMACPGAAMELEDAYVARLGAAVAVGFQLGRLAVTWSLDERHGVLLFEPS
jgi:heat shock protein HslJ